MLFFEWFVAGVKGFGVKAFDNLDVKIDCVIVAVAHDEFKDFLLAQAKFSFVKRKSVLMWGAYLKQRGPWKKGFIIDVCNL